jgi:hypothetical protein
MNGIRIPLFMQGEKLPQGYNDTPNPYATMPKTKYNLRAMVNYARSQGKKVPDLSKEEASKFLIR